MTSRWGTGEKRPRPEPEAPGNLAEGHESTEHNPPQLESMTSPSCTLTVGFGA